MIKTTPCTYGPTMDGESFAIGIYEFDRTEALMLAGMILGHFRQPTPHRIADADLQNLVLSHNEIKLVE